jgi:potassium-transporting ATPase KdpC subunit
MRSMLRPALVFLALMTLLTGVVYPAVITGLARLAFPRQADGSLIVVGGVARGSRLIGQPFEGAGYLWSRPSATSPTPDNAGASSGSNLGPSNPVLREAVAGRIAALRAADSAFVGPVPVDLVTTSGSGLDPHLSPAAAAVQVPRIARARAMAPSEVERIIAEHTEGTFLGVFGERRVNVLLVNLALDGITR